jgi:hypothetical protein
MRDRLIRWLLRLLGAPRPLLPDFTVYALVTPGDRLAEVTTNLFRARAMAIELSAKKQTAMKILRLVPVAEEPYR